MHQQTISDLQTKATVIPVLTKKEKLLHWASIVRASPLAITLFNGLELWSPAQLATPYPQYNSAFTLAANDEKFRAAGLEDSSAAASMKFFELGQSELHEFSCNCGGHLSNEEMAIRIERLAGERVGFFRNLMSLSQF